MFSIQRRAFLGAAAAAGAALGASTSATAAQPPSGKTILVAHGAWSAGWVCFETPVRLKNGDAKMPHAYIYALRKTPADTFKPFADRAKQERWDYREIDASHSPHVTAPEALATLLNSIMAKKPA